MKALLLIVTLAGGLLAKAQNPTTYSVYFATDKHDIDNATRQELESWLKQWPPLSVIELHGYCDSRASEVYNDALSARRVQSVKTFLLELGIPKTDILSEQAHGERMAKSENETEDGRRQNRRVDIIIQRADGAIDKQATKPKEDAVVVPKQSISEAIADTNVTSGSNIRLRNINFRGGMHQILPGTYTILEELLRAMQDHPNLAIEIQGHICCEPGDGDGLDMETGIRNLSEARAQAIHDYLIAKGIDKSRVSYKGFGHSKPLFPYPEQSEVEQIANRRVEIKIIRK
jgi:outer membrane protein OmpA-like peptidoglycan-associated protein